MMPRFCVAFARLAALGAVVALTGCDELFNKDPRKNELATANQKASAGDFRNAVKLYEASLDGTEKSAEVHFKLGVIYDEKIKSPVDALHHFSRYLELTPNGPHAKEARAFKKEAELKLVTTLSKGSFVSQDEAVRLKNENLSLRKAVVELRAQKSLPPPTPGAKGEQVQKPIPPGARTHVVEPGETLASIAVKYYKNKARWKDIQDANFYSLDGAAKIKPGQTLIIPGK